MTISLRMAWILSSALLLLIPAAVAPRPQSDADYDHGFIAYSKTAPSDPIARLAKRVESGETKLAIDDERGYLPAILRELKISTTSQSLVFSRTSFQFTQIAPRRPRALYFNDDVYVGYVQGSSLLEFAAVDPKLGAVFYEFDISEEKPRFQREVYACLLCHDSSATTSGVPGFMTLSVVPDPDGNAMRSAGTAPMNDQMPFKERWGGWYVTGTHGSLVHRGNTTVPIGTLLPRVDWSKGANLSTVAGKIDTASYLTPYSDIVALMALNHQVRIHNLVTQANYETQRAVTDEAKAYRDLARPGERYSALTAERIRGAVEPLVRGMFFANEAPLGEKVRGDSGFAEQFEKSGVRDRKGRSLKDLDLSRRFLRYPLSYLIYTDAFEALPREAREYFYDRAKAILSGGDTTQGLAHLSAEDRTAIREILEDTKPEFRALMKR